MEWINEFSAIVVGLAIRFGIPVGLTLLVVLAFKQLDERWRKSAQENRNQLAVAGLAPRNIGCWLINNCSAESLANCKAFTHPETPCWQVFRDDQGRLKESCRGCRIFIEAPIPTTV
jgi:hypothetical protein